MPFDEILVRGTAWLALAGYCGSISARLMAGGNDAWWRFARTAWTFGGVMFLAHVAAAFHFVHHWSHAAAIEFTAWRTYETIGIDWGGGLYVNHAFLVVWVADVIAWWQNGVVSPGRRSRWIEYPLQFFFAFMWFNATVVFGVGPIRWVGGIATAILLTLAAWPKRARERTD